MQPTTRLAVEALALALDQPSAPPDRAATPALSFHIGGGECLALLATRAAPAATLVDYLLGHLADAGHPAGNGRIFVDGKDISAWPPGRRRLGIVSPRDPLLDHLDLRGNVAFALAVQGVRGLERDRRADEALALAGLDAHARRRPAELDPALTVRAALARALATGPAAIVMEDAVPALDLEARRALLPMLRRLVQARDFALLRVTRDREEALLLGDRVGLLDGTRLRQVGTASELLDRPADAAVATGFGEANSLVGKAGAIDDDVASVQLAAGPVVEAMADPALEPGMLCTVCVRPERIATAFGAGSGEPEAGSLSGILSDLAHLGDHVRLRFRLPGGGDLLVRRPASQPVAMLRLDQPARLAWPAAHAIAFPLEG